MNYLKFVLPIQMEVMPKEFLAEYVLDGKLSLIDLFLTGDILQFAALALLILLLVSYLPLRGLFAAYLAVIILLASSILWDIKSSNVILDRFLRLCAGQPPYTYFPLFPWLVYPLTGFVIGEAIKQRHENLWKQLLIAGCFAFFIELLFQFTPYHCPQTSFYRTWPDATLMHLGFVVAWIAVFHFASIRISDNKFFKLLKFSSKNITLIYFIQWILIFWCFPFVGYHKLGLVMSIIIAVTMSLTVFLLTYFISKFFKRRQKQITTSQYTFIYES
jgi:hypothetical protein